MPNYLISFANGSMDHIPAQDFPEVSKASHAVVQEAKDAGVFVFGGGLDYDDNGVEHAVVNLDGTVEDGPLPETKGLVGGMTIVSVPDRAAALAWAAKIAASCRCAQEVRRFMDDPESTL